MAGLSPKRIAFVEEYLRTFNAADAARRAGYSERTARSMGQQLLTLVDVQAAIKARLNQNAMTTDEVLNRLAAQSRADLGVFFRLSERWTEHPSPTQEVLDSSIETDEKGHQITLYKVRAVVLDTDKLLDPHYSHLIKKFSDTPRNGLSIELHDVQGALELIGRNLGMFKDKVELSGPNGAPLVIAIGGIDPHKDI
jgi:phage terminase small subunit